MQSTQQIQPSNPPKDPIIAAVLSALILGGVGQLYLGQQKKGIILIVVSLALWCISVGTLGWIVQLLGAYDAYVIGTKLKNGQAVGDMEFFWQANA
jgi:TM2 domain-containing membrane protein YozV